MYSWAGKISATPRPISRQIICRQIVPNTKNSNYPYSVTDCDIFGCLLGTKKSTGRVRLPQKDKRHLLGLGVSAAFLGSLTTLPAGIELYRVPCAIDVMDRPFQGLTRVSRSKETLVAPSHCLSTLNVRHIAKRGGNSIASDAGSPRCTVVADWAKDVQ